MTVSTSTTCPYCGVGCGVVATPNLDGSVDIRGDDLHPANFGRLCSKGAALGETVDMDNRLLYPQISGQRVDWDTAINTVAAGFNNVIQEHGPDAVAFYVSGQILTEDYYIANKLMKGFIGSANIDTNSRLCMASSVAGHKRAFGTDTVPCSYEDLEQARLVVLVGSNTAWCHPVLFQRMVQAKKDNSDYRVVVIDPRRTSSCDIADLHLPLSPGTDTVLFNGLLRYLYEHDFSNDLFVENHTQGKGAALNTVMGDQASLAEVAKVCGLKEQEVEKFYRLFASQERVVTVYSQGVNQASSGTDKVNAIINCHLLTGRIGRAGMGPFSFTGQPNAMGGREVGGLANQLAAHMEIANPGHRELVQRFWQSPTIASEQGLKAVDLFEAMASGKVKAVWIMATNPVVSVPDADRVRDAIAQCEFVVVSDCVQHNDTVDLGHVLLPALTWGEKDGTVTNSERRISRQRKFLPPPGEARADWWAINQVARAMGYSEAFQYESAAELFREHAVLSAYGNEGTRDFDIRGLATISDDEYAELKPVQWPVITGDKSGQARMFTNGRFFTEDGRARFVAVTPRPPVNQTSEDFPFILNTGRVRDQWHTMTRTGKTGRLSEHCPEPFADIHPRDAAAKGVDEGALVRVFSRWGEVIVRVRISVNQQPGQVFIPMHWNSQYASQARVDAVVNPAVDPLSGQPEFKHTPVNFQHYRPAWHGFLLTRRQLSIDDSSYWVKAAGKQFYRYELAGEQSPEDWPVWARENLCQDDNDVDWIEYLDVGAKAYRGVRLVSDRIESCLFIAPSHQLPSRSWLAGLFAQSEIDDAERRALLSGKSPAGQKDIGRVVCACFGVGINTIVDAIESQALVSPEDIGVALKAGTNCGSCVPELRTILADLSRQSGKARTG